MSKVAKQYERSYRDRREHLLKGLDEPYQCVWVGSGHAQRSHGDVYFKHRPRSDFLYLSGVERENCILVLLKNRSHTKHVLIYHAQTDHEKKWQGLMDDVVSLKGEEGFDIVVDDSQFSEVLAGFFKGIKANVWHFFDENDKQAVALVKKESDTIHGAYEHEKFIKQMGLMRIIKDTFEISCMRQSAHRAAMAFNRVIEKGLTKPYRYEYEIQAEYLYHLRKQGFDGEPYPPIIAQGANACTLHYHKNNASIDKSACILMDCGSQEYYYASDISRTWPNEGVWTEAQKEIYQVVLSCQKKVIDLIKPGVKCSYLHEVSVRTLSQALIDIGLLKGHIEQVVSTKAYNAFYMHYIGHSLGLDVHDKNPYSREDWVLEEGMVLTIEPGLYMHEQSPMPYRGIGVRIEDDCLVTEKGVEVLSSEAIKEVNQLCV